jgi:hypothetical protein
MSHNKMILDHVQAVQSPNFLTVKEPRNRFYGINSASLCSLAGLYDISLHTRFLAPLDCLKNPALVSDFSPALTVLNNYLWTYDLYGPAHKDFDAGGWITW